MLICTPRICVPPHSIKSNLPFWFRWENHIVLFCFSFPKSNSSSNVLVFISPHITHSPISLCPYIFLRSLAFCLHSQVSLSFTLPLSLIHSVYKFKNRFRTSKFNWTIVTTYLKQGEGGSVDFVSPVIVNTRSFWKSGMTPKSIKIKGNIFLRTLCRRLYYNSTCWVWSTKNDTSIKLHYQKWNNCDFLAL